MLLEFLYWLALGLSVVYAVSYIHFKLYSRHYWKRRNIPFVEPFFIFGNGLRLYFFDSMIELSGRFYTENRDKPLLGLWFYNQPVLMVNDVKLVKQILVKDFQYFQDRINDADEENDALDGK